MKEMVIGTLIIIMGLKLIYFLFFKLTWDSTAFFLMLVFGFLLLIIYLASRPDKEYLAMITASEYARIYPKNKTNYGYSCHWCGSRSIRNWGLNSPDDEKRVFICNHCGKKLYRNDCLN